LSFRMRCSNAEIDFEAGSAISFGIGDGTGAIPAIDIVVADATKQRVVLVAAVRTIGARTGLEHVAVLEAVQISR